MKKQFKTLGIVALLVISSLTGFAQKGTVWVGGEAMYPTKNIVENAVNSKDHTTLVAAVKAAGLVDALMGSGPFTVFAPVNTAFDKLPKGTVEMVLKPENKATLTKVLTYHVVAGKLDAKELMKQIEKGKGEAKLKTLAGNTLTAKMNGDMNVILQDENGMVANISTYNVYQSNGVIHAIDTVLMPK
ncbi:MAG: fasciclin domain-containing protein [Spirosomataceae bacterium]|jgi:uncharacterized surface protein with fasciclin (FAS1) repeats